MLAVSAGKRCAVWAIFLELWVGQFVDPSPHGLAQKCAFHVAMIKSICIRRGVAIVRGTGHGCLCDVWQANAVDVGACFERASRITKRTAAGATTVALGDIAYVSGARWGLARMVLGLRVVTSWTGANQGP